MWKNIDGYQIPYRINEHGNVQGFWNLKWRDKAALYDKFRNSYVVKLKLNGRHVPRTIGRLMAEAFMGGIGPDEIVIHKNGSIGDSDLLNLKKVPRKGTFLSGAVYNRKCVSAIDMQGNVVELYPSMNAAAHGENLDRKTIYNYCNSTEKTLCEKTGRRYQFADF